MARAPLYDNGRLLTAENMQLLILTALVAFLLHKFLLGKKYDGDAAHVLGSASDAISEDVHQVKNEPLNANQNQDISPNNEANDESERPAEKIQVKSATKEAASIRNYDRLLTPAQPANDEQPCEETKAAGSEAEEKLTEEKQAEDPAFYLNFSNFTTAPIEDGHSSSEIKQDTNSGSQAEKPDEVPSYLNFSNFMTASISGVAGPAPPPVKMHSKAEHPGLEAYYHWKSTLTSLYRVYAVPLHSYPHTSYGTKQIKEAVLPMHPSSERGQTAVYIEVTNFTSNDVAVYWVDYKGNENYKGRIRPSEVWHQTTYIGHPWKFRKITNDNNVASDESILLKYVPFRVIPSIEGAETVTEDESTGMQRFALKEVPNDFGVIVDGIKWRPACFVEDTILPEPPLVSLRGEVDSSRSNGSNGQLMNEINTEMYWVCDQVRREEVTQGHSLSTLTRLRQYLLNMSIEPSKAKYRKLRICNPIFQQSIYNSAARGILLALGFEEHYGHLECGKAEGVMLAYNVFECKCYSLFGIAQVGEPE